MKPYRKFEIFIFIVIMTIFSFSCNDKNHIDKYEVNLDSLKSLPDAFYAYRRGNIYSDNGKFMIWFNLNNSGDVKNIFEITDLTDRNAGDTETLNKYKIDTTEHKIIMQKFLNLSRKFKFGHIYVDKANKISFSYQEGLTEQYVKTFNDSLKVRYINSKDFRLLDNGWFEYIEK